MAAALDVTGSAGPLDFYVVRLPSLDAMPFEAVREILSLVDAEIIAVVDLVVIERGTGTTIATTEPSALDPRHPLSAFVGTVEPLLTSADLAMLGESLPPSTCAAVFVIEQVWATTLDETLDAWGCSMVQRGPIGRVPTPSPTAAGDSARRRDGPQVLADPFAPHRL